jgi:hypothetical protein
VAQARHDQQRRPDPQAALDTFYFGNGVGKGPVVHADNYGPKGGQIRTNGFMPDPNLWQLRQFVFDHDCEFGPCIRPTLLKDNPHPQLFTDPSPGAGGVAFKSWFVKQVKNLEVADVNRFFLTDVGTFNAGQSTSEGQFDIYRLQSGDSSPFRDAIEAAITKPGVTTDQILNRTLTLSCAGCHEHANSVENGDLGGGLPWAPSLGFVQVSEEFTEDGAFGPRFPLSDQLTQIFLPHRKQVLEKFLATAVCSNCSPLKVKLFGADIVDPHKFDPPGPKRPRPHPRRAAPQSLSPSHGNSPARPMDRARAPRARLRRTFGSMRVVQAYISGTGFYVPPRVVTNDDLIHHLRRRDHPRLDRPAHRHRGPPLRRRRRRHLRPRPRGRPGRPLRGPARGPRPRPHRLRHPLPRARLPRQRRLPAAEARPLRG